MKILILKFGALGDVIRTSYILPGLHDKYDSPIIDWVTSAAAYDLLRLNPYIRTLASPQTGLEFLKRNYYDLVLSFDDEDDVLALMKNILYERVIGAYIEGGVKHYSPDSSEWFDMGLISRYGKTIADAKKKENSREHNHIFEDMLGIKIKEAHFFNSPIIEKRIEKQFDKSQFNIGINSSAGTRWKSKELLFDEVCALIRKLMQYRVNNKKIKIHLLGGEMEEKRNAEIKKVISNQYLKDWGGQNTLLEFAAIVKNCDYVITSDSLALHFSIAQQVSNLSYYAPTSANEIGTFGTGVKVISLSDDFCSYLPDADNSTITSNRIFDVFSKHCMALDLALHINNGTGLI